MEPAAQAKPPAGELGYLRVFTGASYPDYYALPPGTPLRDALRMRNLLLTIGECQCVELYHQGLSDPDPRLADLIGGRMPVSAFALLERFVATHACNLFEAFPGACGIFTRLQEKQARERQRQDSERAGAALNLRRTQFAARLAAAGPPPAEGAPIADGAACLQCGRTKREVQAGYPANVCAFMRCATCRHYVCAACQLEGEHSVHY